jgi:hypothetical protein
MQRFPHPGTSHEQGGAGTGLGPAPAIDILIPLFLPGFFEVSPWKGSSLWPPLRTP